MLLERKRLSYFTRLPNSTRNMSLTIHIIGKMIALRQVSCARANIHGMGMNASYDDQISKNEYKEKNQFYLISQQRLLKALFEKNMESRERRKMLLLTTRCMSPVFSSTILN